ncbi:Protein arginine N-methyltransferase 7 [Cichlidogyrus casuarinus]|uniref:Protein arginine N-methyltransferase n=1 Tax=Cichlidogyrus casuarinus TaxID=1844966 RepID=A0ABD2QLV2_9PLAT
MDKVIGKPQWKLLPDDYDYHQDIARSGYADMLHDTDRNVRYREAIEFSIKRLKEQHPDRPIIVLDIGTGTGLLSMMAARAGADSVYACEGFNPVAKCAKKIIKKNGFDGIIKVIEKHSTQLQIGIDLPERANMLVAELLDTELIGEAALSSYRHAAENLITEDALLVPNLARLYCHVVESPFLWSHQFVKNSQINCAGSSSIFDLQASQLIPVDPSQSCNANEPQIKLLSKDPILLDVINFAPPSQLILMKNQKKISFVANSNSTAHAFLIWWDLQMEPTNSTKGITMAPKWMLNESEYHWRDHWMQAIYFPQVPLTLQLGKEYQLHYNHDEISIWMNFDALSSGANSAAHLGYARSRIAQLNSESHVQYSQQLIRQVEDALLRQSRKCNVFIFSEASLFPFVTRHLSPQCLERVHKIYIFESNLHGVRFIEELMTEEAKHKVVMEPDYDVLFEKNQFRQSIKENDNLVIAEPFVATATTPWDHLNFFYFKNRMLLFSQPVQTTLINPKNLKIFCVAVAFEHLHKIRHPVGMCEGFDLSEFDEMILSSSRLVDAVIEEHPLWEYPGIACSLEKEIFQFNLEQLPVQKKASLDRREVLIIEQPDSMNGLAFWAEWDTDSDQSYSSTKPKTPIQIGRMIEWDALGQKQGVYLFYPDELQSLQSKQLTIRTRFDLATAKFSFNFE